MNDGQRVLSRSERVWYALVMHRRFIGATLVTLTVPLAATNPIGEVWTAWLNSFLAALGGYVAGAGAHKSDDFHRDKRDALIRTRSGAFPAFKFPEGR